MIYLPPPQPVINKDIRISGDVEIHPTASLAPGVILQAAPDRRIVIGADVCIGMGVIINASQGSIEIESGAILGSGVLIIGECKIGSNACIGTAVTIFQANIEAMTVIKPGSVLGDGSRKIDLDRESPPKDTSNRSPATSKTKQSKVGSNGFYSPKSQKKKTAPETVNRHVDGQPKTPPIPAKETVVSPEIENEKPPNEKSPVVGQVYINQLLVTLFPHNKDLDSRTRKLE